MSAIPSSRTHARAARTQPQFFLCFALLATAAAGAAEPARVAVWTVGSAYQFHLAETRSPTPATDNKAIDIQQDIDIRVVPAAAGEFELDWTARNTVVTPDPEPVRKNIPQLGDSLLFNPDLTQKFALDDKGRVLRVVNLDEIGAAMRKGFEHEGEAPLDDRFFQMITSKDAIVGAVDKLQVWLMSAAAASADTDKSETPVNWPGTTTEIGMMSYEVVAAGGAGQPRHVRVSRRIGKAFANAATKAVLKQFGVPDSQLGQFDGDIRESVDLFIDPDTQEPRQFVYKTTADFPNQTFTMTCDLTRIQGK